MLGQVIAWIEENEPSSPVSIVLRQAQNLWGKRYAEIDSTKLVIAHCKMGGRSAKAVAQLKELGFKKVRNMTGGITAWSDKVDPSVPKY